jgi:FADH2 O2-dependent halogenase
VGLSLDPRLYPKDPAMSPEEDFRYHASRFPDVERQFAGGKAVREWVTTGNNRVQYSSKQTVGDRWCLLGHAAAFIDPLFSFGLANTGDAVNALAWRLIRAVKDDDFSADRFAYFDRWQQARYHYNDEMVNAGYTAFDHFELWKAVFRIWVWGDNAGTFRLRRALTEFEDTGRDGVFQDLEKAPHLGFDWPDHDGYKKLYDEMVRRCDAVQAGEITADEASDALWSELRASNFMPKPFGYADPSVRFMSPQPKVLAKTALWALREADPAVRQLMLSNGRKAIKSRLHGDRIF